MNTVIRTYSELILLPTFEERFKYLKLSGSVGKETFGFDRWINQFFYQRSYEWKKVRDYVIIRDNGCDLGMEGYEVNNQRIIIHHMNPISMEDFERESKYLLDPEFLISTTHKTHNAIHYGDERMLFTAPVERTMYDTCPWKK